MTDSDFATIQQVIDKTGQAITASAPDEFAIKESAIGLGADSSYLSHYNSTEFVRYEDVRKVSKLYNDIVESVGFRNQSTNNPNFKYNLSTDDGIDGVVNIEVKTTLNFELFIKFKEGIGFKYPSGGGVLSSILCSSPTGDYLYLDPIPDTEYAVSVDGVGLLLKVNNLYNSGTYNPDVVTVPLILPTGPKNVSLTMKFIFTLSAIKV